MEVTINAGFRTLYKTILRYSGNFNVKLTENDILIDYQQNDESNPGQFSYQGEQIVVRYGMPEFKYFPIEIEPGDKISFKFHDNKYSIEFIDGNQKVVRFPSIDFEGFDIQTARKKRKISDISENSSAQPAQSGFGFPVVNTYPSGFQSFSFAK